MFPLLSRARNLHVKGSNSWFYVLRFNEASSEFAGGEFGDKKRRRGRSQVENAVGTRIALAGPHPEALGRILAHSTGMVKKVESPVLRFLGSELCKIFILATSMRSGHTNSSNSPNHRHSWHWSPRKPCVALPLEWPGRITQMQPWCNHQIFARQRKQPRNKILQKLRLLCAFCGLLWVDHLWTSINRDKSRNDPGKKGKGKKEKPCKSSGPWRVQHRASSTELAVACFLEK